ncbi:MAG TPA: hypothetical protein PLY86_18210 [bacterium]|nr:hypothetical protein [bacterium]
MNRKIVVLWDKTLPVGISRPLTQRIWRQCAEGTTVRFAAPSELAQALERADLLINPYGDGFPLESWSCILNYLESGGNYLNWGGVPFRTPIAGNSESGWRIQRPCTCYHRRIGIVHSRIYSPDLTNMTVVCHPRLAPVFRQKSPVCPDVYPLTIEPVPFDRRCRAESSPSRSLDIEYRPLLQSLRDGVPMAAPVTRLDRMFDPCKGGRWILATVNLAQLEESQLSGWIDLLPVLIRMAAEGATTLEVLPTFATYLPSETPVLRVTARNIAEGEWTIQLSVSPPQGHTKRIRRKIKAAFARTAYAEIPLSSPAQSGFYSVQASLLHDDETIENTISGFWGRDESLLYSGKALTTDGEMVLRDGEVYPLIGASYGTLHYGGTSLRYANPGVWDQDFAEMAAMGIRLVRVSLWDGGVSTAMPESGVWREEGLRELDAFLLTAQRHRIPVLLTMLPLASPCYRRLGISLDSEALSDQEEFVRLLAERYKSCPGVIWDLVEEPAIEGGIDSTGGECLGVQAWNAWLLEHHGTIENLRERWDICADEALGPGCIALPVREDFAVKGSAGGNRCPLRAMDYMLFVQSTFSQWLFRMKSICRHSGSRQLVLLQQYPEQSSLESEIHPADLVSIRTSWNSDSPLWERMVAKVPGIPSVVEEAGTPVLRNLNGEPWRTEEQCAALLERKYLYALATVSAGAIHLKWRTAKSPSRKDELSGGLIRDDGTMSPGYAIHRRFNRFWWENRNYWTGRQEDRIALVLPRYSRIPPFGESTGATRRAVQVLTKALHMGATVFDEQDLPRMRMPKMVILPSPGALSDVAWKCLVKYVEKGGTLVMSGVVERDSYFRITSRLGEVGIPGLGPGLVAPQELMFMSGDQFLLTYSGQKPHWLEREVWQGEASVWESHVGRGQILFSPQPLEFADQFASVVHFYTRGMELAQIEPMLIIEDYIPTTYIRLIRFREADLVVAINEASDSVAMNFSIRDLSKIWRIELPAQRGGAYLIHRERAEIIDQY